MKPLNAPRLVAATLLVVAALSGCGDRPAEKAGRQIDQATSKAAEKIDEAAGKAAVKIDQVADKASATIDRTAGEVAQKVEEATSTVRQEAEIAGRKLDKAGDVITDAGITAQVKAAILAYPGLKSLEINVDTTNGVVKLTGTVDSPIDRQRSAEIAAAVAGVKSVSNQLTVTVIDSRQHQRADLRSDATALVSRRG